MVEIINEPCHEGVDKPVHDKRTSAHCSVSSNRLALLVGHSDGAHASSSVNASRT